MDNLTSRKLDTLISTLQRLVDSPGMRVGASSLGGGTSTSTPFNTVTDYSTMPFIESAYRQAAPIIGKHVYGIQDPYIRPYVAPGQSVQDAYTQADVTTPQYKTAQSRFHQRLGEGFGHDLFL